MELPESPAVRRALAQAVKRLTRQERFSGELRAFLEDRGHSPDAAGAAVAFLETHGLLDDGRAIETFIEARSGRRAVGRARLRDELIARGAPEALAELAAESVDDEDEVQAIRDVLASRTWRPEDRTKAGRFLCSRGFEFDRIEAELDSRFGASSD